MAATDKKPVLPEATVRLVYQLLLRRDVENDEAMEKLRRVATVAKLRDRIINSPEYKGKLPLGQLRHALDKLRHEPRKVDIEVTPGQFELLFERLCAQWIKLGETEPHWSVMSDPVYKADSFSQHEEKFYGTGNNMTAQILSAFHRAGQEINPAGTVLELGCGTGRVTHALADRFAKVIGVDVSPGNLRLCEEKMREMNKTNVECRLLKSPVDIENIPPIDFFYSVIVLQHNPPPVMHYFLSKIFSKIRPGGAVFFQLPTNAPRYSFDVEKYLGSSHVHTMDMHCLPMPAVFALLEKYKLSPMEVLMDTMTGNLGSHTFFAVRK